MTQPGDTWAVLFGALTPPHCPARAGAASGRAMPGLTRGGRADPLSNNGCLNMETQPAPDHLARSDTAPRWGCLHRAPARKELSCSEERSLSLGRLGSCPGLLQTCMTSPSSSAPSSPAARGCARRCVTPALQNFLL